MGTQEMTQANPTSETKDNGAPDAKIRDLLTGLSAVLNSPQARDPVEAIRTKSTKGYATGKQCLADARQWIEERERELDDASGDETRIQRLHREVKGVHAFVNYDGEQWVITLEGTGLGIDAWRAFKLGSRNYRHLTGPDWHRSGPLWPRWSID
jgi:hypothetical protein